MQRLPVGGLRYHPDLTLIRVDGLAASDADLTEYLSLLDRRRLNLSFLTLRQQSDLTAASWCIATRDTDRVLEAARRFPRLAQRFTVMSPACALSVFPHRNRLAPLCLLIAALKAAGVPVLSLGTSISAISCILSEACLPEALGALEGVFELPENHAPIRIQLRHEPVLRGEEP